MQYLFSWYFGYRKTAVDESLKKKEHGVTLQKKGLKPSLSKSRSVY